MIDVLTLNQLPERVRLGIEAGATRFICPKCKGGLGHEASLGAFMLPAAPGSVEMLGLRCFRNTCGWLANVILGEGDKCQIVKQSVHEARVFTDPTMPIGRDGILYPMLLDRYELPLEAYDERWVYAQPVDGDSWYRLVMPVLSPVGVVRGYQTRTFPKMGKKRVSAYKESAQPWLDWWLTDVPEHSLYVVEDQISACKLHWTGRNAVSLMGTNMSIDKAKEIAKIADAASLKVKLTLDPDAINTAFKIQSRYAYLFPSTVLILNRDPKDCCAGYLDHMLGPVDHG